MCLSEKESSKFSWLGQQKLLNFMMYLDKPLKSCVANHIAQTQLSNNAQSKLLKINYSGPEVLLNELALLEYVHKCIFMPVSLLKLFK